MANWSESGVSQARASRLELLHRDIEDEKVFFGRVRHGLATLVTCELNMPVASRSADECAVVAAVSRKLAKLLKTQDVNVKAESCRNLTHRSGHSHRRGRERSSAHCPHCRGVPAGAHPAPVVRDAQTGVSGHEPTAPTRA